jgi:hypothetical protein
MQMKCVSLGGSISVLFVFVFGVGHYCGPDSKFIGSDLHSSYCHVQSVLTVFLQLVLTVILRKRARIYVFDASKRSVRGAGDDGV